MYNISFLKLIFLFSQILIKFSLAYDENLFSDSLIVLRTTNETLQSRTASFGPRLGEGLSGVVIPMEEIDPKNGRFGCEVLNQNSIKKLENIENGFIALVERGRCSFSDKVRNMQKSGAKAVIVGNNHSDSHLITMYANGDSSDITIPSVFIVQLDLLFLRTNKYFVDIIESEMEWPITDIFMMTTLLPVVFIIGIVVIYKFKIDTFDAVVPNTATIPSVGAASSEDVYALPTKVFYMEKKKELDPDICAICIEDFKDDDELRVLPCKHEFHIVCIDPWLITRKRTCPICKRSICKEEEEEKANENTPLLNTTNNNTNYTDNSATTTTNSTSEDSDDDDYQPIINRRNINRFHNFLQNRQYEIINGQDDDDDDDDDDEDEDEDHTHNPLRNSTPATNTTTTTNTSTPNSPTPTTTTTNTTTTTTTTSSLLQSHNNSESEESVILDMTNLGHTTTNNNSKNDQARANTNNDNQINIIFHDSSYSPVEDSQSFSSPTTDSSSVELLEGEEEITIVTGNGQQPNPTTTSHVNIKNEYVEPTLPISSTSATAYDLSTSSSSSSSSSSQHQQPKVLTSKTASGPTKLDQDLTDDSDQSHLQDETILTENEDNSHIDNINLNTINKN